LKFDAEAFFNRLLAWYGMSNCPTSGKLTERTLGAVIDDGQPRCSMNQTTRLEETKNCPQAWRHADFVRGSSQIKTGIVSTKISFICGPFFVSRIAPALCRTFSETLRGFFRSFLTTPRVFRGSRFPPRLAEPARTSYVSRTCHVAKEFDPMHEQDTGQATPETASATIVIFGASGDLTARKLVPALFELWNEGFLADNAPIVGAARREKTDESFRNEMHDAVNRHTRSGPVADDRWAAFAARLFYRRLDLTNSDDYTQFAHELQTIEEAIGCKTRKRVVYLATAPKLFLPAVEALSQAGLIPDTDDEDELRVVLEKPFGHDLESARDLSHRLRRLLVESQTYRIDHYLGKETVQNILLFRFGNSIFEPLLNRNHIDHVQITVAESQGMERGRGGYYDRAGALRDVLQNHVLQLLSLVAMEPPALFRANDIRDEKLKVLKALSPGTPLGISDWAIAGQYDAGTSGGETVRGYREEDRVAANSRRETYVAMQVAIDNWRWAGVPFYLRTGKRMPERVTEIAIQFKPPPLHLFTTVECEGDICDLVGAQPNSLVFRIQPRESISLSFSTKRPGMQYQIHPVPMDFAYESQFEVSLPEAYERLLLDVLRGDSTLFTRSDELEAAWRFVTPILEHWENEQLAPEGYAAGSWGPKTADQLLQRSNRRWRTPHPENND